MDYQYQAVEQPSNPRKTWPIVLSVVVALTVACGAGVYVYHNKRQEALDTCRQSLAEFSSARKAVLDTSENGSELQKLIRGALGVNDIIDAFADAATSAENTVDTEGCKADATITQLNLIAKTLDSATDSLNNSLKDIREKNGTNALQDSRNDSDGTTTNGPSSNTQSNTSSGQLLDVPSNGSSATESLDELKKELQQSLDKADKLVNKLDKDETLTLTGRKLLCPHCPKLWIPVKNSLKTAISRIPSTTRPPKSRSMRPSMWPRIGWTDRRPKRNDDSPSCCFHTCV